MANKPEYAIILDFEATCDDREQPRPQEIIEFPSVILSLDTLETIDEFRAFVKPHHHPVLTDFCKTFTSILQEDIDAAQPFMEVFTSHHNWLLKHGLTVENSVFVSCGDWDLGTMLPAQCVASVPGIELIPPVYLRWHNIKKSFCKIRNKEKAPGMAGMLKDLGLEIVGHHHCGIDDCRNITELCRTLVHEGAQIEPTKKLSISKYPPITIQLRLGDRIEQVKLGGRSMKALIGIAGKTFKKSISGFTNKDGIQIKEDRDLLHLTPGEEILVSE